MLYRPFGRDGRSISALTLVVGDDPKRESDRTRLIYAALEAGVNSFELCGSQMVEIASSVARALSAVPRAAVVVSLRLPPDSRKGAAPFSRDWVIHGVERTLYATGYDRLDLLTFQLPGPGAFGQEARAAAVAARETGRVGLIGAAGESAALDEAIRFPELDVLVSPYNLRSEWPERNRLKAAAARNLVVLGANSYPALHRGASQGGDGKGRGGGLFGLGKKVVALEQVGGYAFLDRAPGWTPQQVCLTYALTEPGLASVLVEAHDPKGVEALAEAAERTLPVGMPAQIEMARFSAV